MPVKSIKQNYTSSATTETFRGIMNRCIGIVAGQQLFYHEKTIEPKYKLTAISEAEQAKVVVQ